MDPTELAGRTEPMRLELPCAVCGKQAVHVELVPPAALPLGYDGWPESKKDAFHARHDVEMWLFVFEGVVAGNGMGDDISGQEALRYAEAFAPPHTADRVAGADLFDDAGFCRACNRFYCSEHWGSPDSYGTCPKGHGRSLDPHWSPDFD